LTVKSKLPASYLDARQVDHDLITGGWRRLVYAPGRPEGTVHRAAYVFCLLEQFHRHIKHRNIYATASSRWRDPRAHLLSGAAWDTARGPGMNALGLPEHPHKLLAGHATALDTAYREVASRLDADTPATADADGRLHVAALSAVPDPASLRNDVSETSVPTTMMEYEPTEDTEDITDSPTKGADARPRQKPDHHRLGKDRVEILGIVGAEDVRWNIRRVEDISVRLYQSRPATLHRHASKSPTLLLAHYLPVQGT
jgi:hypothetical protein